MIVKYKNPIVQDAPDPFIMLDGDYYYLYATTPVDGGYRVRRSTDLINWEDCGMCLREKDIYGAARPYRGFWAPEVYRVKDKYYLFYSVDEHIGVAISDSPLGPFKSPIDRYLVEHNAIDATLFTDHDGQTYLYYVGWGGVEYGIFGRTIDLDTFELGEETPIIRPVKGSWESAEGWVTEGPFMLYCDGKYYLTYSGNGYESHKYAVGYAVSDSPLGKFVPYENNPILSQKPEEGVFGPGHHCFFVTKGGDFMIAYHRHFSETILHNRTGCIDHARFAKITDKD